MQDLNILENHVALQTTWPLNSVAFHYIDGLVQDCSNSIANALELLQSSTKPSIWKLPSLHIMPESLNMEVSQSLAKPPLNFNVA